MSHFKDLIEWIALLIDGAGVLVIVAGILIAGGRYLMQRHAIGSDPYHQLRLDLGRGILLGLERLVAADIIRTVAVPPTLDGVMVLGLIVLIRTFLSMALQVEPEGRWPWQRGREGQSPE
jgi:uncharacterized membrane protein